MLQILTITVRQITNAFALAIENVQQDYLSKKEEIWLLCLVSLILFSGRKKKGFTFAS